MWTPDFPDLSVLVLEIVAAASALPTLDPAKELESISPGMLVVKTWEVGEAKAGQAIRFRNYTKKDWECGMCLIYLKSPKHARYIFFAFNHQICYVIVDDGNANFGTEQVSQKPSVVASLDTERKAYRRQPPRHSRDCD